MALMPWRIAQSTGLSCSGVHNPGFVFLQIPDIIPAVRDVMMNRTFIIIRSKIQEFEASVWVTWFTVKLIPILPSFTAEMLVTVTANISCTNYHVM